MEKWRPALGLVAKSKLLALALVFISCSQVTTPKPVAQKRTIHPGEVIRLSFGGAVIKNARLVCGEKGFIHYHDGRVFHAYISETYFSKLRSYKCVYGTKAKSRVVAQILVKGKEFPKEKLRVDRKRLVLSKKDYARVLKEVALLRKIYARSAFRPHFSESFAIPLASPVTSIYGTQRTFNNIRRSQHLGTDFRAAIGTPIRASNAGKVVLAKGLFYSGKTAIIDHGMGIFTTYAHLSKLNVKANEVVTKNTLLGFSGKSGRVTGPHLHWGVKVNGNYVDGNYLVAITQNPPQI